jgi:general secretion pathway protein F/type IV pilus assembly protein PilC
MAIFRYKELNFKRKGYRFIDAENLEQAKKKLNALKLLATNISEHTSFRKQFTLNAKIVLSITKDLYYLLHSNLPLYESLITLEDKYTNTTADPMILDWSENVKYGKALSSIISQYTSTFNPIYVSMIKSAEQSGRLDKAFFEISTMIETNEKWNKKIRDTLLYPSFLLSFAFFILFGLFLFIIPSMGELFEGRTLHPLTHAVLTISHFMTSHIPELLGTFLLSALGVFLSIKNKQSRNSIKKFFYKIRIIKDLTTKIAIVRFTTSLYNLLDNTVPILTALELSKGSLNHPYLEKDIDKVLVLVREGELFSKALQVSTHFPLLVSKMISTGEHAGALAPILRHITSLFHEEVQTALEKFTALLQPILLLLIGLIVGVVLLAVLIPLTDVSSLL